MIYISQSNDERILGVTEGISALGKGFRLIPRDISLFQLLHKYDDITSMFINEVDIKHNDIHYAKKEFPHITFNVFINGGNKELNCSGIDNKLYINDELTIPEKAIIVPPLTHSMTLKNGEPKSYYESEITYISNRPISMEKVKWLAGLGTEFRLKIYGNYGIPAPYYLGMIDRSEIPNVIKSSRVVISFFGQDFFFDTYLNDRIGLMEKRITENDWEFNSYNSLREKCKRAISATPEWKEPIKKKALDYTYKNFVVQMSERLGI